MGSDGVWRFEVKKEHWPILEQFAAEAECSPARYIEQGIEFALFAAHTLLENLEAGKEKTGILDENEDASFTYYDVGGIFQPYEDDKSEEDVLAEAGIVDPFVSAETIPIELDAELIEEVDDVCAELGLKPADFIANSVTLRRIMQLAYRKDKTILLETSDEDEYFVLSGEPD